jgi:hypothetical protein
MVTRLLTLHSSLTATATESLPRPRPEGLAPRAASVPCDPLRADELRAVLRASRQRSG